MAENMKTILLFSYPMGDVHYHPAKWCVWHMLRTKMPELTDEQCEKGFETVNLMNNIEWSSLSEPWKQYRGLAKEKAALLPSLYEGRTIVVFGEGGRRAVGLPKLLLHPLKYHGIEWRQLPHPIGSYRWYKDRNCRDLAIILLHELYVRGNPNGKTV